MHLLCTNEERSGDRETGGVHRCIRIVVCVGFMFTYGFEPSSSHQLSDEWIPKNQQTQACPPVQLILRACLFGD